MSENPNMSRPVPQQPPRPRVAASTIVRGSNRRTRQLQTLPDFQYDGIVFVGTELMTLADWAAVSDHPHQRDTIQHAKRSGHLRMFSEAHRRVSLGLMPDGSRYKGDGHTRTYMWANGMTVGLPDDLKIVADVYRLADESALAKFYELFDNKQAVDTLGDELLSATKFANVVFQSVMMKKGHFVSAVRFVHGLMVPDKPAETYTLRNATQYLAKELMWLDSINPAKSEFNGGVTMAALLTITRDGSRALDFWRRYNEARGWKTDDECDAVQALTHFREYVRKEKQSGMGQMVSHLMTGLSAYLGNCETPCRIYKGKKAKPRPVSNETFWKFVTQAQKLRAERDNTN